jgi:hypothetical protein
VRTTADILRDLRERQAAGHDVRQEIISHEAIARLRAELAGFDHRQQPDRANGLHNQIGVHLRLVTEQPADGEQAAAEPAADPAPARAPRPPK